MSDKELEKLLFEDNDDDAEKFDIDKWALATVFSAFNEVFSKYTSVSQEERESYFKKNANYPNVHILCNLLVPHNVFVIDKEGKKARMPAGAFEKGFIVDAFNQEEVNSTPIYWAQVNYLRDRFYSFSKAVSRFKLDEDDLQYIFFICLTELLDARLTVFRRHKRKCLIPAIDITEKNDNVDILRMFIDFEKIPEGEIAEIYEQDYFYENCVTIPIWQELNTLFDQTVTSIRTRVLDEVANDNIKNANDKRQHLIEVIFQIDTTSELQKFHQRTNDLKFLELERSILINAKNAITEIVKLNQNNFENMSNNIVFNGPVGQAVIDSNISNSSIAITMPDADKAVLTEIKNELESLRHANVEQQEWQEVLVQCISEINAFENAATKVTQKDSAKKVISLFQRLKDLKDSVAITFLTVDIAQKLPKFLEQGETFFKAVQNL